MTLATIFVRKGSRILIVEDNLEHLEWFRNKLKHTTMRAIQDPEAAVDWLRINPPENLDAIFLDFDLGPGNMKNSTINSIPVIDFLNSRLTTRRSQRNIVIHSCNEIGAAWMQALLPGAVKLPFGSFDIEEIEK